MEYLQKWNEARQAIAEANSVDELSAIIDMAEAYRYALKQAKEGIEVVNQATEIKLRAERKAGKFLHDMPKNTGGGANRYGRFSDIPSGNITKIPELGITYKQSSQWQQVASIPEEKFEQHILEIQQENEELTRAKLLRVAQEELAPKPKQEPIKSNTIFINNDDPVEAVLKTVLDMGINYMKSGKTLDNFLTFLKHYILNYQKTN
jgi:hypothetical protein